MSITPQERPRDYITFLSPPPPLSFYVLEQSGRSGKTIPELEKTIGLMKKVVERVQRENDELKKAPGMVSNEKIASLEQEKECLKVAYSPFKNVLFNLLILKFLTDK